MSTSSKIDPILAGVAGEYYVAAELSRRGYIASISLRNTRGIDLLVSNADASRNVSIQVKTNQLGKPHWILSKKAEDHLAPDLFYVFVTFLGVNEPPRYHVVPSEVVAQSVREAHAQWLSTPRKDGRAHEESAVRKFSDAEQRFVNRWDLLFP